MAVIQCNKIYLFESTISDPYFIGSKEGIETTFDIEDDYKLSFIDIDLVNYEIGSENIGGLVYTTEYGGENYSVSDIQGKTAREYTLEINIPVSDRKLLYNFVGRQYSILCMRDDGSHFIVFGMFEPEVLTVDNEIIARVSLATGKTLCDIIEVESFNISRVEAKITGEEIKYDDTAIFGFDYELDLVLN